MNLVEVPIKSSADIRNGMVLIYDSMPKKRWVVNGNYRHTYTIDCNGQKIPVSNRRRNKFMISDFDDPTSVPFLSCFDIEPVNYKVYQKTE